MTIKDLETKLGFTCLQCEFEDGPLTGAYTSDLLSDVMANAPDDSVLITIQAHKNTVAVSTLADVKAILLCNKRIPEDDMLQAAKNEKIAIYQTDKNQFQASCLIGAALEGKAL
ncbi:MAG: hypothetical protein JEY99_15350 [Spirochaetales bacterium]|nr:hypothetical protein [Spirochaetales bacterium]